MRVLALIIFLIFILSGQSIFPAEINGSNGNNNGPSNNINNQLFPYGLVFLKNGTFDGLINSMSEEWKVDLLLGSKVSESTNEFDWQKWLQSTNSGNSRVLLGGLPFISIPNHSRQDDEQEDAALLSTDKFFFFWYFKQKF
jgi:hypothetical protein